MRNHLAELREGVSILDRSPVTVAGAFLIAVQATMAALFAVLGDAHVVDWLTISSQALVTAAIMAIATFMTMLWTAKKTTPTAAPVLPEKTKVALTNGDNKTVAALATLPTVKEANTTNG